MAAWGAAADETGRWRFEAQGLEIGQMPLRVVSRGLLRCSYVSCETVGAGPGCYFGCTDDYFVCDAVKNVAMQHEF